jgi:hypothetical protein
MRFAGWYLKIAAVGASIGAAMELFMIHTGFCTLLSPLTPYLLGIQSHLVVSLRFLIMIILGRIMCGSCESNIFSLHIFLSVATDVPLVRLRNILLQHCYSVFSLFQLALALSLSSEFST